MRIHEHAAKYVAIVLACTLPVVQPARAAPESGALPPGCTDAVLITALRLNPELNRLAIDAAVAGDRAVLEGVVRNDIQRDLAGSIALAVPGIVEVDNRLLTRRDTARNVDLPPIARAVMDANVVARVKSQLHWSSSTRPGDISIQSHYGRVTLSGTVPSEEARAWAERIATNTYDVKSVINGLEVSEPDGAPSAASDVTDSEISAMVTQMLRYNRLVDDTHVDVSTVNGKVSLYGRVPSADQRDTASELVRGVVGVEAIEVELDV